jgi:hypothetical protein
VYYDIALHGGRVEESASVKCGHAKASLSRVAYGPTMSLAGSKLPRYMLLMLSSTHTKRPMRNTTMTSQGYLSTAEHDQMVSVLTVRLACPVIDSIRSGFMELYCAGPSRAIKAIETGLLVFGEQLLVTVHA